MTDTATGDPVTPSIAVARPTRPRRLWPRSFPAHLALAAVSGVLVAAALPPHDLWPLAVLGVALLTALAGSVGPRRGALLGLAHGLGTFVPLLTWMTVIGTDAWLLLALLEAGFLAGLGAAVAVVWRLPVPALWVACVWVAQEAARSRAPFGGFPWGRLAHAESASPLTPYAALGGAPLVTFVTALAAALVVVALRPPRRAGSGPGGSRLARRGRVLAGGVAAAIPVLGVVLPTGLPAAAEPIQVALVQGGVPGEGLDFLGEREQVLRNHVAATRRLARDVRSGRVPAPDLVVWPENSSDIDPFGDARARALIDEAVRDVGVPVLVGAVVDGPGPDYVSNTGVVWDPNTGPGERYVKRHPVPFGEYIPFRSVLSGWIERLEQIPRDFYAADKPGNLTVGPAQVGDVICFEVAYDGLVRDVVVGGAQVLVVQTNNATYNSTGQPQQQLALSRLRAVEHGRPVLIAATSGISAVVSPDGTVRRATPERAARTLNAQVLPRTGQTLATRVGAAPEWVLTLLAVCALGWGLRRGGAPRG